MVNPPISLAEAQAQLQAAREALRARQTYWQSELVPGKYSPNAMQNLQQESISDIQYHLSRVRVAQANVEALAAPIPQPTAPLPETAIAARFVSPPAEVAAYKAEQAAAQAVAVSPTDIAFAEAHGLPSPATEPEAYMAAVAERAQAVGAQADIQAAIEAQATTAPPPTPPSTVNILYEMKKPNLLGELETYTVQEDVPTTITHEELMARARQHETQLGLAGSAGMTVKAIFPTKTVDVTPPGTLVTTTMGEASKGWQLSVGILGTTPEPMLETIPQFTLSYDIAPTMAKETIAGAVAGVAPTLPEVSGREIAALTVTPTIRPPEVMPPTMVEFAGPPAPIEEPRDIIKTLEEVSLEMAEPTIPKAAMLEMTRTDITPPLPLGLAPPSVPTKIATPFERAVAERAFVESLGFRQMAGMFQKVEEPLVMAISRAELPPTLVLTRADIESIALSVAQAPRHAVEFAEEAMIFATSIGSVTQAITQARALTPFEMERLSLIGRPITPYEEKRAEYQAKVAAEYPPFEKAIIGQTIGFIAEAEIIGGIYGAAGATVLGAYRTIVPKTYEAAETSQLIYGPRAFGERHVLITKEGGFVVEKGGKLQQVYGTTFHEGDITTRTIVSRSVGITTPPGGVSAEAIGEFKTLAISTEAKPPIIPVPGTKGMVAIPVKETSFTFTSPEVSRFASRAIKEIPYTGEPVMITVPTTERFIGTVISRSVSAEVAGAFGAYPISGTNLMVGRAIVSERIGVFAPKTVIDYLIRSPITTGKEGFEAARSGVTTIMKGITAFAPPRVVPLVSGIEGVQILGGAVVGGIQVSGRLTQPLAYHTAELPSTTEAISKAEIAISTMIAKPAERVITPTIERQPTRQITPFVSVMREITSVPQREILVTPTREIMVTPTREITVTPTREITVTPTREITVTPTREITITPTREVTRISEPPIRPLLPTLQIPIIIPTKPLVVGRRKKKEEKPIVIGKRRAPKYLLPDLVSQIISATRYGKATAQPMTKKLWQFVEKHPLGYVPTVEMAARGPEREKMPRTGLTFGKLGSLKSVFTKGRKR